MRSVFIDIIYKIVFFCIIQHLQYFIKIVFYTQFSFYVVDMFRIIKNHVKGITLFKKNA